jgi:hypothetical protein
VEGDWKLGEVECATKAGRSIGKGVIVGPICGEEDEDEEEGGDEVPEV